MKSAPGARNFRGDGKRKHRHRPCRPRLAALAAGAGPRAAPRPRLPAAFAVWRATTVRVWLHDGRLLRQGTAVTIVLWLVAIAIHLGGDHLIAPHDADRLGSVSLLLYLGVSLAVQRFALGERARRLLTAGAWPDDATA
jgi:hypothetical protein